MWAGYFRRHPALAIRRVCSMVHSRCPQYAELEQSNGNLHFTHGDGLEFPGEDA